MKRKIDGEVVVLVVAGIFVVSIIGIGLVGVCCVGTAELLRRVAGAK